MEIYNEQMELIDNPDLTLGWLRDDVRIVHHEAVTAVDEVWHHEVVAEYPNGGKDVARVIDTPGVVGKPAWDERIPIQVYIPYTEEELAQREEEINRPSMESRVELLETENKNLKEALELLLSGATEDGVSANA